MPILSFVPVMNRNSEYAAYDIGDYSYGHPKIIASEYRGHLKIGRFCSIGDDVIIFLGDAHRMDMVSTYPLSSFFAFACDGENVNLPRGKGDTVIGNDVWIGHGAFLLDGITIGDGAVIGAKAVVAKDIPPYAVAVGNPARVVKYRFPVEICQKLLEIAWWNWSIDKIAEAAMLLCSPDLHPFLAKYGGQYGSSAP